MTLRCSEKAKLNSERLIQQLQSGEFKKNCRPNHAPDFSGGAEELYRYRFNKYLGSCSCFLMDKRLKDRGTLYHG